eukprot:scaffold1.g5226.t1
MGVVASALAVASPGLEHASIMVGEDWALSGHCTNAAVAQLLGSLAGATRLQTLAIDTRDVQLSARPLSALPLLGHLRRLERLVWRVAWTTTPPPGLEALTGLTRLEAGDCNRRWLPAVAPLEQLRELQLSSTFTSPAHLAPALYQFGHGDFDFLSSMPQLTSLSLQYMNGLRGLPPVSPLCACTQLRNLSLSGNDCSEPGCLDGLSHLHSLTSLCVRDAGLEALPPTVSTLTALQDLDLFDNDTLRLTSRDVCTSLAALTRLTSLWLSDPTIPTVAPEDWQRLRAAAPRITMPAAVPRGAAATICSAC